MTVQSPLDIEAANPNLVGGDNNAGSMHLNQLFGNRPFPGSRDHRSGIAGLYLCGASTWPGGGSNPGSGLFVAEQVVEDCL